MSAIDRGSYAVLIGIEGYERAADGSEAVDRPGSVREIETWDVLLRRGGVLAEDVRWCVSPLGRPRSNATAAKVRAALAWLLERLAHPGARGVLVVAAHVDEVDGARLLRPSDAALDPKNLIDLDRELVAPAAALATDYELLVVVSPPRERDGDPRITLATTRLPTSRALGETSASV
ncbi:MAG: hypothetical protein H6735_26205 [Alphaproteobacteria bacterium]|nr:hypothetical protein [Alphaproteobacteria bacterium]